jgi:hypothetical protein
MSEIKVNKLTPRTNCGTVTLGDSGDTFTIPSGVTISNSGTAAGFGSTGEVSWNTTKITADPANAVSGIGYFCDTSGGAFDVTLPTSPSAGDVVAVADYTGTFGTNALTVARNGSNINGAASNYVIGQNNVSAQFIYVDGTEGWKIVFTGSLTGDGLEKTYIVATGGTPCTGAICGDYKVHSFTGPGTFTVCTAAGCAADNVVDYLVIAGGGAGGHNCGGFNGGGGGGAGGFRFAATTYCSPSPLKAPAALPVCAQAYPITVGAGGVGASGPAPAKGNPGNGSTFSTIASQHGAGGASGGGGSKNGDSGGSGGGGTGVNGPGGGSAGTGNTPPVSPSMGNDGGAGNCGSDHQGGGGGGFTAVGQPGACGGDGGAGLAISITGSPVARGGGGGGARGAPSAAPAVPQGGLGGGGDGSDNIIPGGVPSGAPAGSGTINTGGGGGGTNANKNGGSGGSGIVVIRYKFQ